MKIRINFVSNSSSSSFVLLGFKMNKEEWTDADYSRKDVLGDDGPGYIGEVLGQTDDNSDCFDYVELDINQLQEKFSMLAKKYDKKPSEIKLIIGTRAT